jgi:hypothetical protein
MNVTAVPNVKVYTRHSADCPKACSRAWKRCGCPKWLYWRQDGKALLQSAKTRSWEKAQEAATAIEERFRLARQGKDVELPCGMTVKEAVRLYLEDKREQHSGGTLLSKLTRLLEAPSSKGNKEAKPGELPVEDREVKPGEVLGFAKWCATKQTPAIKDVPLPVPSENGSVTPYAAEVFPSQFDDAEVAVVVISPERTFWEKATILHREYYRAAAGKPASDRVFRHYDDVAMISRHERGTKAIEKNMDLLEQVAVHKQHFFREGPARYELARKGTLRLCPSEQIRDALRRDYEKMREMYFGEAPDFDEVMETLKELESRINDV